MWTLSVVLLLHGGIQVGPAIPDFLEVGFVDAGGASFGRFLCRASDCQAKNERQDSGPLHHRYHHHSSKCAAELSHEATTKPNTGPTFSGTPGPLNVEALTVHSLIGSMPL